MIPRRMITIALAGLLISLLAACQTPIIPATPTPEPTATPTLTPTPRPTATPTAPPTPTATVTATPDPTTGFVTFPATAFTIQHPPGWVNLNLLGLLVFADNAEIVTAALAMLQGQTVAIPEGALLIVTPISQEQLAATSPEQLLQQIVATPDLVIVAGPTETTIDGRAAIEVTARYSMPAGTDGTSLTATAVIIYDEAEALALVGITTTAVEEEMLPLLRAMIGSIQFAD
jgi:hypothetical protein